MPLVKRAVVKIPGTPFRFDGEDVIMPPLALLHLSNFKEQLKNFKGDTNDMSQIDTVIDVCHAALSRNYPELTREEVGMALGLESFQEVMIAIVKVSGLVDRLPEEELEEGEK